MSRVNATLREEIIERKRAEEETQRLLGAVQEDKDRLSALITSMQDEVWFADAEKKLTLANPAVLQEFGVTIEGMEIEKIVASAEVYRPDAWVKLRLYVLSREK